MEVFPIILSKVGALYMSSFLFHRNAVYGTHELLKSIL
ncbi:hypothetical protein COK_2196 [Mannheimia haemolytica serotype A2 str. BOVINE]|nr:hypothetical protein COK_2196 [Mannheimia haemolytica serotype A2 str. BOVINE]